MDAMSNPAASIMPAAFRFVLIGPVRFRSGSGSFGARGARSGGRRGPG